MNLKVLKLKKKKKVKKKRAKVGDISDPMRRVQAKPTQIKAEVRDVN